VRQHPFILPKNLKIIIYQTRFRWAVCQLDALGKCLNLPRLRNTLERLPDTLDGTYDRILCAIDKEYSQDALKILQWLVYSARPLRIDEVVDAIAVYNDRDPQFDPERRLPDPQDILIICSSLVTIAGVEIRLAHFSVKEYLVSKRIQNGPASQYSIRSIPANLSIAETCLAYLLQFDKATYLTFQSIKEFPLARYAARYWTQHARAAKEDAGAIHQVIMQLFQSKTDAYANWAWLFDTDWPWHEQGLKKAASPLYYVSLAGLTESVRLLIENGANVNAQGGKYKTALQAASARGHNRVVQLLLDAGANVNTHGGIDSTALQAAAANGHDQIVQLLLKNGADVNMQGGEFDNALQAASYGKVKDGNKMQEVSAKDSVRVVQCLLENGANINGHGGKYGTGLQAAAARGCDQVVQLLLENGADVNIKGGYYGTALHAAVAKGHAQIVQLLLENGADVNAQGGRGGTALYAALVKGHEQIVHWLLGKGADVNAQGGEFYGNALQAASAKGSIQVVQWLVANGASINAQGGDYGTALQAAAYKGHEAAVQPLLYKGAEVNAQGGQYGNALQAASHGGHEAVVRLLLEKGAVDNGRGREYADALQAAAYNGNHTLVQLLTEMERSINVQSDTRLDQMPVLHDHRWLRGKIWMGDYQFTGQLLVMRYIATTATIEAFPLIAKDDSASIPFSLDPSIMVGSFSPNIQLQEEPEI
jgi:ankyrin repeat protein